MDDDFPPEPPKIPHDSIRALIAYLDRMAAWMRRDHSVAAEHGHEVSPQAEAVLRLHEDSALLLRETYDVFDD